MSTGMTWEECRTQLDLPRLVALRRYWTNSPPIHMMVAAYFGIGDKKKKSDAPVFLPPIVLKD